MTMYSNVNFFSALFSIRQISYEVMRTSKSCGRSRVEMMSARSSLVPVNRTVLTSGVHLANSRAQFWRVDLGTTTK